MAVRALRIVVAAAVAAGCGRAVAPAAPAAGQAEPAAAASAAGQAGSAAAGAPARPAKRAEPSDDEKLAAIQKAMNELDEAAQQCWAVAATERFDIAGEIALQIEISDAPPPGAPTAHATVVRDTAHDARLPACLIQVMAAYRWAPPLHGQAIQLPFRFRAPDGQSTIDRGLVTWRSQGQGAAKISVAVLIDEANTGSSAASLIELAIAAGGTTGLRRADRAELWYFLAAGRVASPAGGARAVAAGDMMYVPRGGAREVAAGAGDLHAVIAIVPGGREGAARGGALPTPELGAVRSAPPVPVIVPAAAATVRDGSKIFAGAAQIRDRTLSAAVITVPAGARVAEHAHAGEAELLYVLAGAGTLTVNGVDLPVTATSVIQIPKGARHAFAAAAELRAVQIYTPGGPEQSKAQP